MELQPQLCYAFEKLPYVDRDGVALLTVDVENDRHIASSPERCGKLHVELVQTSELTLSSAEQHGCIYAADRRMHTRQTAVLPQAGTEEDNNHCVGRRPQVESELPSNWFRWSTGRLRGWFGRR